MLENAMATVHTVMQTLMEYPLVQTLMEYPLMIRVGVALFVVLVVPSIIAERRSRL